MSRTSIDELERKRTALLAAERRKAAAIFARGTVSRAIEQSEDLYRDAILRLLFELRRRKAAAGDRDASDQGSAGAASIQADGAPSIRDLHGLAMSITRNLVNEHLRNRYPNRSRLKQHIVYALTSRDPKIRICRFALWTVEWKRVAGYQEWQGQHAPRTSRLDDLQRDPEAFLRQRSPFGPEALDLRQLLEALFDGLRKPIELDVLVTAVARIRGIEDLPDTSLAEPAGDDEPDGCRWQREPRNDGPLPEEQTVMRSHLRHVWRAICQLSSRQAAALLLNLRDSTGSCVIGLLPELGIASRRRIADAIGMPVERLLELWASLPLDDETIGRLLGCPAGRVAVLWFRARQRLQSSVGETGDSPGDGWGKMSR